MKRSRISKETRADVYAKYNGHCAYCGKKIDLKDMQVDHVTAYGQSVYGKDLDHVNEMINDGSIDNIENLMPSCRACNYYKNINDIEGLRWRIQNQLSHTCIDSFQTRLAMQYGMVEYKPWDGKFYFEKINDKDKNVEGIDSSPKNLSCGLSDDDMEQICKSLDRIKEKMTKTNIKFN